MLVPSGGEAIESVRTTLSGIANLGAEEPSFAICSTEVAHAIFVLRAGSAEFSFVGSGAGPFIRIGHGQTGVAARAGAGLALVAELGAGHAHRSIGAEVGLAIRAGFARFAEFFLLRNWRWCVGRTRDA